MRTWLRGWALVVGLVAMGPARAQTDGAAAPDAAAQAPPATAEAPPDAPAQRPPATAEAPLDGVPVRALLRDQRVVEARLAGSLGDGLALRTEDGALRALTDPDVAALQVQGRAWNIGALLGASLGGLGGGVWLGLRCGNSVYGYVGVAFCSAMGEVAGAATGALVGALVGGAVPMWRTAWRQGEALSDLQPRARPAFGPWLGEVALLPGYAWRLEDQGEAPRTRHGPGLQLQFLTPVGRHAALGLEGAAFDLGTTTDSPLGWGEPVAPRRLDLWRVGPVARVHLPLGRVRPGVLAGLALSVLDGDATAVASAGLGVDVDVVPGRLAATAQVRGGRALDRDPTATHSVTVGAGARLLW